MFILQITLEERINRANEKADERLRKREVEEEKATIDETNLEVKPAGELLGGKDGSTDKKVDEYIAVYEAKNNSGKGIITHIDNIQGTVSAGNNVMQGIKAADGANKWRQAASGFAKMGPLGKASGIFSLVVEPISVGIEWWDVSEAYSADFLEEAAEDHGLNSNEAVLLGCSDEDYLKGLADIQAKMKEKGHSQETIDKKVENIKLARKRVQGVRDKEFREAAVCTGCLVAGVLVGAALILSAPVSVPVLAGLATIGTCMAVGGLVATGINALFSGGWTSLF